MVRAGKPLGVNWTVWVLLAGTVTSWLTVIGVPLFGGVMVAVTVALWAVAVLLVTSVLMVRLALDRSAVSLWLMCELPTASVFFSTRRPPPRSTLFPYTTLFR